ncbi:hypothetical protein ABIF65_001158 [Bradyrhizobium japonicum]|nr:hypothetical protein [Bradyrhizobium japonicum]MCP1857366.1 hypothetical protein [Bradyrhizobium japonicum]MCW2321155.1 hypothetical protein [Bradyrhizobium japonicum]
MIVLRRAKDIVCGLATLTPHETEACNDDSGEVCFPLLDGPRRPQRSAAPIS